MGDDITIGVTEIVNNIEVTAQPNDQIVDISVTDNADNVTLNITPTVIEINVNKGSSFAKWGDIYGTLSDQTDLQNALNLKANLVGGKVPASELPSYVDDIIEVANYAALPATGEIGKIYVTLDNNKIYRWSGSVYIEIASNSAIWGAITGTLSSQTDLQNALNAKEATITAGTTAQYWRGDKSWQTLDKNAVGLGNVDNTSDLNKPISTATQTALGLKQNTITLTTTGTTGAATLVGSTLNIPNYTTDISGLVPYTGATTNVDLGSHKLTASDLVINHASGSGVAASITKGGSGEALTVVKSSGSGNAASITGGTTLLSELHLTTDLADDYIASAATWNAKQSALNGTGFVKISGTTISYDNTTYLSGTGTTNYIPKFTGASAIGNSLIYDNGTNVGIGTTSPLLVGGGWRSLNIDGTKAGLVLSNSGLNPSYIYTNGTGGVDLVIENSGSQIFNAGSTERMRITSSGNVGIGVASPRTKLDVEAYTSFMSLSSGINSEATTPDQQIGGIDFRKHYALAIGASMRLLQAGGPNNYSTSHLAFYTNNGDTSFNTVPPERMRITSGGNVGIGTTSPASKLHVVGYGIFDDGTNGRLTFENASAQNDIYSTTTAFGAYKDLRYTANNHIFRYGSSEAMRITSGGNVGIGTTSPDGKLHVAGSGKIASFGSTSSGNDNYIQFKGTTKSFDVGVTVDNFWGVADAGVAYRLVVSSSGSIGIGTTSPSTKLDVVGAITASGGFFNSDMRLKDLTDYDYNVSDIKPITYLWKDGRDDKKHVGYSAQEVQKVMPDAVNEGTDGMLSVNYVEILVAKIAQMEKEIELLKSKI